MAYVFKLLHIGDAAFVNKELILMMVKNGTVSADGTVGTCAKMERLFGVKVKVQISNAASAEDIRAKARWNAGAILIYDTTRRESFECSMKWIDSFRCNAPKEAVVILLANKSSEYSGRRAVSKKEGESFAENVGALYYEVDRQLPASAQEALFLTVKTIYSKVQDGLLGTRANEGIKLDMEAFQMMKSSSTTALPDYPQGRNEPSEFEGAKFVREPVRERSKSSSTATGGYPMRGDKDKIPEVVMLKSELSYMKEEVERLKHKHQLSLTEQARQQQEMHQLRVENMRLKQQLAQEEDKHRDTSASHQRKCSELEQENSRLRQFHQSTLQRLQREMETSSNMQQQLQQQLWLKGEEASQREARLQKENRIASRQLQEAMEEIRQLRIWSTSAEIDHWRISAHELSIGDNILGQGAWGYVVEGKFHGQRVAVKCLHEEIAAPHTMERVYREIRTMAHVRHPNLVLFIAAVVGEGPPMIVTEVLDTNLRRAYEEHLVDSVNIRAKIEILRGVACALNYLHKQKEPIIHRDVSAPNVLLEAVANQVWKPKVSDFGSANLARHSHTLGEGAIIYAAPETFPQQAVGDRPSPPVHTVKIDVYSYGILFCEVLSEQLPDPSNIFYMLQQVERQWPNIHEIITSCTKKNADERPTMATVIDRIDTLIV